MAISNLQDVSAQWNSKKLADEVRRSLGLGLGAAAVFLSSRVKELVSVPAPRVRILIGQKVVNGKQVKVWRYRATTKATKDAPPRKLSGRLRASITWEKKPDGGEIAARVGTNVKYARRLELEGHAYLHPSLNRWRNQLKDIMERAG